MNKNMNIDFIGKRKMFLIISACILLVGLAVNLIFGVEMDISFKGGTLLKYSYTDVIDKDAAAAFFTEQIGEKTTVDFSKTGDTQVLEAYSKAVVSNERLLEIEAAVDETYADNAPELLKSSSLPPREGTLFFVKCLVATLLACLFLIVYVAIRFRKIGGWSAGFMAVVALVHDLLIVYFAFVIFRIPLNDNFVAVMLTILGYSLNDTIVVYDRIRENRTVMGAKTSINEVVNASLNQSFRRTMNTSITTSIVVVTLVVVALVLNLDSIISFAVPLLFGVVSGFYSSTFLCPPVWAALVSRYQAKKAK